MRGHQQKLRAKPKTAALTAEMTPAQTLYAQLSKVPVVPVRLEKTLTPAFTKEFFRIMTSKKMVEMDWLYLSGELNADQAMQYGVLSGDFDLVQQQVNDLAKRISAHFNTGLLLEMVKNEFKGKEKEGVRNLFQQIENLHLYLPVPNSVNIPPPLVINNLKNWGYSLMEYARELGAKI
jgi:hypothetical protein